MENGLYRPLSVLRKNDHLAGDVRIVGFRDVTELLHFHCGYWQLAPITVQHFPVFAADSAGFVEDEFGQFWKIPSA